MFISWVVFPLVLAVLALGCGLLLEQTTGWLLPGPLVLPAGLAVMIVVAGFTTATDATAELTVPVIVFLAVAGVAVSFPWRDRRIEPWAIVAAVAVFVVFALPTAATGTPTFAGYIKLDDTATWFTLTDRVMEHGRNLNGLAPSSYEATLDFNLASGYPVGAFLPLGIGRALVGKDVAWLFQPYIAFLAAMLALTLYWLAGALVRSRVLRAFAAVVAGQAALLFGYSLWGGVKEVCAAALIALAAALAPDAARIPAGLLRLVPLAVAVAAVISVVSVAGAVWLVPALVLGLVLAVQRLGFEQAALRGVAFAGMTALLSLPVFTASGFLPPTSSALTSDTAKGNLIDPLSPLQFFGIWPVGDFRLRPGDMDITRLLIAVVVGIGLFGLWWAVRRRAWTLIAYVGTATLGCLAIAALGSPWVDGKTLAIASPAFLFAALVGAAVMFERGRRVEAVVIALAIASGVVWSNALAYRDVDLAPHARFAELEGIGKRIAGEGPALTTDYEPYAVRHFLRDADPQGASELRRDRIPLRNGGTLDKLGAADIDEFALSGILPFRTMVLRRSPASSRPPSPYRLVERGRWYDVWQRPVSGFPAVLAHVPLGDRFQPVAQPSCDTVRRLAGLAGRRGGRVAAALRAPAQVIDATAAPRPGDWRPSRDEVMAVVPGSPGTLTATVRVPADGEYELWLGGSFRREVELRAQRARLSDRGQLSHESTWQPMGEAKLRRGSTDVTLTYGDADLHPGSGKPPYPLGPIALTPRSVRTRLIYVSPQRATELCGRSLDWIEALAG